MEYKIVEITLKVEFDNGSLKGSWNILKPVNLKAVKLDFKDIKQVEPAYFEIPGDLYEEQDGASHFHPCGGSVGVWIMGKDDVRRSIEEIFYYDYNVNKTHYNGLPHWNHERRFNDGQKTWRESKKSIVEHHQIPDSHAITIMMLDPIGNVVKEKTVNRIPIGKVRKK